ncbi:MAG: AAA family ATPase [Candidatus Paceibacterota bacterium]|jgi:chromosome segregation protein
MRLKNLELNGFKSFSKKTVLEFSNPIVSIVGPNGSGKSNVVEAIRFVLGEQSIKSMRGSLGADLIFKGSKNLPKSSRAAVTIYFDNSDKVFKLSNEGGENINLNYDTISISREVYGDGLNKYILNGGEVRLKDIHNLLSSVNIGSSGHHIISQGEADRILNASPKDRREMVEDALGLKIYQYKIKEAGRKLEKTSNNMKEVALLRRENAPHLNFLKKQVDKFEKAKEMQVSLLSLYREYLKKESIYLEKEKSNLNIGKNRILTELENVKKNLSEMEESEKPARDVSQSDAGGEQELKILEKKISEIRSIKNEIERKLGRIEGMIEMEERRKEKVPEVVIKNGEELKEIFREINSEIEQAVIEEDIAEIKIILLRIRDILNEFNQIEKKEKDLSVNFELQNLKKSQQDIVSEMHNIEDEENKILNKIEHLKKEIIKEGEVSHLKEQEKFNFRVKQQELASSLEFMSVKESNLTKEIEAFENEIKEGGVLVGSEILSYKNLEVNDLVDRNLQEELKRKIERIKIKLEDAGLGGGSEVIKEFEEVTQRDNFLAKEMNDLAISIESINKLMADLKEKIDIEFKEGVKKINIEFNNFFSLMFGGGTGTLSVVTENKKKKGEEHGSMEESLDIARDDSAESDIVFEQGIEINVSLPHKKVKELNALSGGERSLTSIALLFAMSQVNPPPFLVLDETDAALDEANSRKYGDMLEKLSKHSQLIVVTHNRETMSRAGILYGVTIGSDGASKLLSVKLDEATAIAK